MYSFCMKYMEFQSLSEPCLRIITIICVETCECYLGKSLLSLKLISNNFYS